MGVACASAARGRFNGWGFSARRQRLGVRVARSTSSIFRAPPSVADLAVMAHGPIRTRPSLGGPSKRARSISSAAMAWPSRSLALCAQRVSRVVLADVGDRVPVGRGAPGLPAVGIAHAMACKRAAPGHEQPLRAGVESQTPTLVCGRVRRSDAPWYERAQVSANDIRRCHTLRAKARRPAHSNTAAAEPASRHARRPTSLRDHSPPRRPSLPRGDPKRPWPSPGIALVTWPQEGAQSTAAIAVSRQPTRIGSSTRQGRRLSTASALMFCDRLRPDYGHSHRDRMSLVAGARDAWRLR